MLTDTARDMIAQALIGQAITHFGPTQAWLGVGDSSTAAVKTQTDLQAASNKFRKLVDVSYPQRTANVLTYKATFAAGEANFAWNEFGTFNAASAGSMLQRATQSLGTKAGGTWELTITETVTN